jgi:hypothetical protein
MGYNPEIKALKHHPDGLSSDIIKHDTPTEV